MAWTPPPFENDEDAVTDRILDAMATRMPGWEPVEGAPEVVLAEEIGRETARTNALAATLTELAVAGIGETVFGVTALPGAHATMLVDLVVTAAGVTIPAGFTVVATTAAGLEVAFELPDEVTADTTTPQLLMRARDVGAACNHVPPGPVTVVTATAVVTSATAASESTGGTDPETLEAYLGRLVDYIGTLRPGGVRATDLATLARNVNGVQRALGVDLYDPANPGVDAERTVTVFPIDAVGAPVTAGAAAEVEQLLESVREVNFQVFVADPTYTPVHVTFEAVAETGADPATVQAAVHGALTGHLHPGSWGSTPGDPAVWAPVSIVRYLDLARIAGSTEGVAYLSALTVNGGTADVILPGPAPLPAPLTGVDPSTITGTVT